MFVAKKLGGSVVELVQEENDVLIVVNGITVAFFAEDDRTLTVVELNSTEARTAGVAFDDIAGRIRVENDCGEQLSA